MPRIVLASASPRRKALLESFDFEFSIHPANVDESVHPNEPPADYVRRVARRKAEAVASRFREGNGSGTRVHEVILAADTVVVHGGEILGKPDTSSQFESMMRRLSGTHHQVTTAVVVAHPGGVEETAVTTTVWFRPLSPEQISWYWASGEPVDKAGGYAIQGLGGAFVERIDGSHSNVIGLPIPETLDLLHTAGVAFPWSSIAGVGADSGRQP